MQYIECSPVFLPGAIPVKLPLKAWEAFYMLYITIYAVMEVLPFAREELPSDSIKL